MELTINERNLTSLVRLANAPPGSVRLVAKDLEEDALNSLVATLHDHGAALDTLEVSRKAYTTHDLTGLDFARIMPNLTRLVVGRCRVNESVLAHPKLRYLKLKEAWLVTRADVSIGEAVGT